MATTTIAPPYPIAYSIYALLDPRTEMVYYVGQTMQPHERLLAHCSNSKNENQHPVPVYRRTKEILKAGYVPQMIILDAIETPHKELVLRLEECYRVDMMNRHETLENAWKTGRCIDTTNPMAEAEYVKGYALATDEQIIELRELDKVRALRKVFG